MKTRFFVIVTLALALCACSAPKHISYVQDASNGYSGASNAEAMVLKLMPGDQISVIVTCKDPALTSLFNLPYVAQRIGSVNELSNSIGQGISGYLVAADGCIDFPVAGKIKVAGHSREEVADIIKTELQNRNLVKDPVVTVEYMNLGVAVMGEVNKPGRYTLAKDGLTVFDALSMAGDLTIYGRRENVKVVREVNGDRKVYELDLCSMDSLLQSPAFYVQQNDIVYVEPNDVRARQSTVNGNNVLSTSFWISIASLASTITMLIWQFTRK